MKKKFIILAALIAAQLAQAKDYVVVVKPTDLSPMGKTEVHVDKNMNTDTLSVKPAKDIEAIYVTLTDATGNVVQSYYSPAKLGDTFTVITPFLPTGYRLEIRDDKGVVYESSEN